MIKNDDSKNLKDAEQIYMKLEDLIDTAKIDEETSKTQKNATATDMQTVLTFLLQLQNNPIWTTSD